jgi:ferredoxin-NADP reductase
VRRIPATRRRLRLISAALVAPGVRHLVLETADGAAFDHLAGQWVKLYLPGGVERDYSIASAPGEHGAARLALLVTKVEGGPGSGALHAMQPGEELDALGPNGLFVREDAEQSAPALFVGTGTGVAPLRAMIVDALGRGERTDKLLLFGCRTEADVLFAEEWRARGLRFEPTLSRASDAWAGRRGYVQAHLAELLPTLPAGAHVYVCGLTKMIDDVRRVLKEELGVDRRRIHSERYD